jgi:hypothetical protein
MRTGGLATTNLSAGFEDRLSMHPIRKNPARRAAAILMLDVDLKFGI